MNSVGTMQDAAFKDEEALLVILKVSDIEPKWVLDNCAMNPAFVHNSLGEFLNKVKATREARESRSLAETKLIVMDLAQSLLEIGFQALRTVPWTDKARQAMRGFREYIEMFDNWGYMYDYQMTQPEQAQCNWKAAKLEPLYSFMTLFKLSSQSDLYESYIVRLNCLITYYNCYITAPKISVAVQAIEIGRVASSLAIDLFQFLCNVMSPPDCDRRVTRLRVQACIFSRHFLLTPILSDIGLICNNCLYQGDMESVWRYLIHVQRYNESEMEGIKGYSVISMKDPLDPDYWCAFAVLNHDVTCPFTAPDETTPEDLHYPMVYILHLEVHAEYRRCGIGSFLMRFIKKEARSNGFQCLSISDSDLMQSTEAFWTAMGFSPSKYSQEFYEYEFDF